MKDAMVHCDACGFNVERYHGRGLSEDGMSCAGCVKCDLNPDMKESYRRGFNAGLEALSQAQDTAIRNLLRR